MGSYKPLAKKIKCTNMEDKTPVSLLQEFCVQEKVAPPSYETHADEHDPKKFICFVQAFGTVVAKGSGLSKIEAKHAAAASLIHLLAQMDPFKSKIKPIQHTPTTPVKDKNAVGDLITFCMQHDFPTPTYRVEAAGPAHQKEFTAECQVGGCCCTAKGMTKQKARHFAAEAMLMQLTDIEIKNNVNNTVKPLTVLDLPTIEEVIAEYRRLKTPYIKRKKNILRIRPNFFLELPKADRDIARVLLNGENGMFLTDKEIVHLVCDALKLKYTTNDMFLKDGHHMIFSLIDCEYDCVIVGTTSTLFAEVIKYLNTMLDIEKPFPRNV